MKFQVTVLDNDKRILWETSIDAPSEDEAPEAANRVAAEKFPDKSPEDYDVVLSQPM